MVAAAAIAAPGYMAARGALLQALVEAKRRAGEVEGCAEAIFEEALVTEVQRLGLVGEENESGRSRSGLGDVENFHLAAGGGGAAIEVHIGEPAIQLAGGDAPL